MSTTVVDLEMSFMGGQRIEGFIELKEKMKDALAKCFAHHHGVMAVQLKTAKLEEFVLVYAMLRDQDLRAEAVQCLQAAGFKVIAG